MKKITAIALFTVWLCCVGRLLQLHYEDPTAEAQTVVGPSFAYKWVAQTGSTTGQLGQYIAFTGTRGPIPNQYSLQWTVTGTAPSACTFSLQGSNDYVTWTNLDAGGISCTANSIEFVSGKAVGGLRVNLATWTPGDATTKVSFSYVGSGATTGSLFSGQTIGFLPVATSATGSTASSSVDEGIRTANTVTVNDPAFQVFNATSGVTSTLKSSLNSSAGGATQQLDMGNASAAAVTLFKLSGAFDWRIGMSGSTDWVLKDDNSGTILIDSPLASKLLKVNPLVMAGTKFTTSGCSISATTGGATGGTFTLGANTCTAVVTMNGATGVSATNGWSCQAHDRTAPTVLIGGEASSTATTASFTIPAGAGTTDVISFACMGY